MLARVVNNWIYQQKHYIPGDLVNLNNELFSHVSEGSIIQKEEGTAQNKLFSALTSGVKVSDEVKAQISLVENDERWFFRLGGVQHSIPKERHEV